MKAIHFKLTVFALMLTSVANVYAATSMIPSRTPGFSVSLTGLSLRPNADNLTYAIYTTPLPLTTPNWTQVTIKPGYSGAFDLGARYNFADAMNQANLDWMHISTSDSDSYQATAANTSVAPPYYFGPIAQALVGSSSNGQVKFNVDNVNLTFGRAIDLGSHVQLNPYAGLEGVYLKQEITASNRGVDSLHAPYLINSNNTSKFTGIGPRVGANATYFVTCRFGLSVAVGGSMLVGTMNTKTNFNSFGGGNKTPANTSLANQNLNKVVPEVDSKIEASYFIPIKSDESNVTLSAGYLFVNYTNGINQVFPTTLVPGAFNAGVIAIESSAQTQSNLSLNGPYASVVWKF